MDQKKARNIKENNKTKPNDIFITPLELAKKHIDLITYKEDEIWLDPFKNNGSYYNQYPNKNKKWCEILDNKDFFKFNEKIDIICSNPPYSCIDDVLKKSIELEPRIISYLLGVNNLTCKRIEYLNKNGYGLKYLYMTKIYKWFGMSYICHFEKGCENCILFDRNVWY